MNQNIKLVVCDIDSTLTTSDRRLSEKTKNVINRLHAHGIYFGIASGRSVDQQMKTVTQQWGFDEPFDVLIGMNGSEIWDNVQKKRHDFYKLKREWMKEIIEMLEPFDLNPLLYYHGRMLCKKIDDETWMSSIKNQSKIQVVKDISELYSEENAKIMFRMPESKMEVVEKFINEHPSPYYKAFKTQTTMLEFTDRRISKDVGLKKFCEDNQIDLSEVVAFGDMTNDNELLMCAGWGVCMINGSDDTKAVADDITRLSNDEDGFAYYMEEHFLNQKGW